MRRQQGSALLVTIMLLILIGFVGMAALDTVTRDQQVAGYQNRETLAFYAAEAGLADAKDRLRNVFATNAVVPFPLQGAPVLLGDTVVFPYGQPSYYGDPAAGANPISYMNTAAMDTSAGNDMREGKEQWFNTLWDTRIQGQTGAAAPATSRLEAVLTRLLTGGAGY